MIRSDYNNITDLFNRNEDAIISRISAPLITNDKGNNTHLRAYRNYSKKVLVLQSGSKIYYNLWYLGTGKYSRKITKVI